MLLLNCSDLCLISLLVDCCLLLSICEFNCGCRVLAVYYLLDFCVFKSSRFGFSVVCLLCVGL